MEKLPHEVVIIILVHTRPRDVLAVACVNRFFHRVAMDPVLHRSASFQGEWCATVKFVTRYITRFKKTLISLDLKNCYWIKSSPLVKALCRCQDLVQLDLLGCNISHEALAEILSRNKNMKSLAWSLPLNFRESWLLTQCSLKRNTCGDNKDRLFGILAASELNSFELQLPSNEFSFSAFDSMFKECLLPNLHVSELKITSLRKCAFGKSEHLVNLHVKLRDRNLEFKIPTGDQITCKFDFERFITDSALASASHNGDLEVLVVPCSVASSNCHISLDSAVTKGYLKKAGLRLGHCATAQSSDIITSLTAGCHLTHLYLAGVDAIDSKILMRLAVGCPSLTSLNLFGCQNSLNSLEGVQALASYCPKLKHLNLADIHYHNSPNCGTDGVLLSLSRMPQLTSLALPVCGVSSAPKLLLSANRDQAVNEILQAGKRVSRGCAAQKGCGSCDYHTLPAKSSSPAEQHHAQRGSFADVTVSCKGVKQFELIAVCFEPFSNVKQTKSKVVCPQIECNILKNLVNWKYLEELTLAGLPLSVGLERLVDLTRTCSELKHLSLAQIGSLQHSGGVAALCRALSHCSNLLLFRLQQPYLNVTPALISSLYNAKELKRVCILSRKGNLDSTRLLDWFEKCQKLTALQIFAGNVTLNSGKTITNNLMSRYSGQRPALCVTVGPYQVDSSMFEMMSRHTPLVHLREVTLFSSKVATFAS